MLNHKLPFWLEDSIFALYSFGREQASCNLAWNDVFEWSKTNFGLLIPYGTLQLLTKAFTFHGDATSTMLSVSFHLSKALHFAYKCLQLQCQYRPAAFLSIKCKPWPKEIYRRLLQMAVYVNRPLSAHQQQTCYGCNNKKKTLQQTLKKTFKSTAVDLQVTVIPGRKFKDWHLRFEDSRDNTSFSFTEN